MELNNLLPSVNRKSSELPTTTIRALICNTINIGPNTDPWGTPRETICHFDGSPFTNSHFFLLLRKSLTQFIERKTVIFHDIWEPLTACETFSKAFIKSQ